ncbi:MAG: superoxide dismutase [Myxococcales bacterium]|nr:superoxide dismutase [Myxococcales bacterium]
MTFSIPDLPYAEKALEPAISGRTVDIHYNRHHKGYLDKLNRAVDGKPDAEKSLEELIRTAGGDLYNHAAQVWNHTFYWKSMTPEGGGEPPSELRDALVEGFGSVDEFKRRLAEAAAREFGSGWAWLVQDDRERLRVLSSSDAENPIQRGYTPLLTLDVWEHAYYLDYQNDRSAYIEGFLDRLIHWGFVADNLARVDGSAAGKR